MSDYDRRTETRFWHSDWLRQWALFVAVGIVAVTVILLIILTPSSGTSDCIRANGDWYCR